MAIGKANMHVGPTIGSKQKTGQVGKSKSRAGCALDSGGSYSINITKIAYPTTTSTSSTSSSSSTTSTSFSTSSTSSTTTTTTAGP